MELYSENVLNILTHFVPIDTAYIDGLCYGFLEEFLQEIDLGFFLHNMVLRCHQIENKLNYNTKTEA